jgi:Tfp pilus assembly protein PilX
MKNNIQKQQGTILIVSLVLLAILTLAGVSNMRSTTLDLKISTNSRASFNNFQAANSAISQAMGDNTLDYTDSSMQSKTYKYLTGKDSKGKKVFISVKVEVTQGHMHNEVGYGQSLGSSFGSGVMYREIKAMVSSGNSNSVQKQGIKKRM